MAAGDLERIRIDNFAGGWNIRDAASELQPNESPDLWNVTLDERGGIVKTLGRAKYNGSVYDASHKVQHAYEWPSGGHKVIQSDTKVYLDTSTSSFKTFTTSARVGFADYNGKLYIIHPVDGLFVSDGTSGGTSAVAGGPKGTAVVAWQNRLLALGDPATPTRVQASKVGDPTSWTPAAGTDNPWEIFIRVLDDKALVGFEPALGVDVLGRPGLIVFKGNSTYRIYDSSSGAYVVLSNTAGAASALSVWTIFDRVGFLSTTGIYEIVADGAPQLVSSRLQPLFTGALQQIDTSQASLFCAGVDGDRVRMSLCRYGSSANDLALEYHPLQGWIVPGSLAASCYATNPTTGVVIGGHPTTNGQVHTFNSGGSDDGTEIASWFQTKWFEPNAGMRAQLWRLRMNGRGTTGNIYLRKDYAIANDVGYPFSLQDDTPSWDTGVDWDNDLYLWGPQGFQQTQDFYGLGTCDSAVAFRVEETSSSILSGQQIAGGSTTPTVGAWALYNLDLLHVPLGVA
jgi:hypothetical protein